MEKMIEEFAYIFVDTPPLPPLPEDAVAEPVVVPTAAPAAAAAAPAAAALATIVPTGAPGILAPAPTASQETTRPGPTVAQEAPATKPPPTGKEFQRVGAQHLQHQQTAVNRTIRRSRPGSVMNVGATVRALYPCVADDPTELSFKENDVITDGSNLSSPL